MWFLGTLISFIWIFFYMRFRNLEHPPGTHLLCLLASLSPELLTR